MVSETKWCNNLHKTVPCHQINFISYRVAKFIFSRFHGFKSSWVNRIMPLSACTNTLTVVSWISIHSQVDTNLKVLVLATCQLWMESATLGWKSTLEYPYCHGWLGSKQNLCSTCIDGQILPSIHVVASIILLSIASIVIRPYFPLMAVCLKIK